MLLGQGAMVARGAEATADRAAETPRGAQPERGPFWLLPIFDALSFAEQIDDETLAGEMDKLLEQLGPPHASVRLGFSFIYRRADETRRLCRVALAKNLSLGIIFNLQNHNLLPGVAELLDLERPADLRLHQWRQDGQRWHGLAEGDAPEVPERDLKVVTPSRYAQVARAAEGKILTAWAAQLAEIDREYPGCIGPISVGIEAELAAGGQLEDALLADYGPFAQAEFVDWLRHRGAYDLDGPHAGEGAPPTVIGPWVAHRGGPRSRFYDHPSPAEGSAGQPSFNATFGTNFTSWRLKYWDPTLWPEALTDPLTRLTPPTGRGFHPGGFDAPRRRLPKDPFWRAWSYDVIDQGGALPAGEGEGQGFGFRQAMVRHYVADLAAQVLAMGLGPARLFAHQIPGELLKRGERLRSGATPVWTGLLEVNGHLGATRFGRWPASEAAKIARRHGIFEWVPVAPDDPQLRAKVHEELDGIYANGGVAVFPGWWQLSGPHPDYPLNDAPLAAALGAWARLGPA